MVVSVEHFYAGNISAAAVGQAIDFSFIVKNNGLLSLFSVTIKSNYLETRGSTITCSDSSGNTTIGVLPGNTGGMAKHPNSGLIPGQSIVCAGSVSLLQAEVSAD